MAIGNTAGKDCEVSVDHPLNWFKACTIRIEKKDSMDAVLSFSDLESTSVVYEREVGVPSEPLAKLSGRVCQYGIKVDLFPRDNSGKYLDVGYYWLIGECNTQELQNKWEGVTDKCVSAAASRKIIGKIPIHIIQSSSVAEKAKEVRRKAWKAGDDEVARIKYLEEAYQYDPKSTYAGLIESYMRNGMDEKARNLVVACLIAAKENSMCQYYSDVLGGVKDRPSWLGKKGPK